MSTVFWVATIVMAVLAFSFVAGPLIKHNWRPGLASIAITLPLFSAGMYWLIGSPQLASATPAASSSVQRQSVAKQPAQKSVGSVASMVDGLAKRLEANPDDGKSWLLLARSYKHLNRTGDARYAYEKAASLGETDEELAVSLGSSDSFHRNTAEIFGNVQLSEEALANVLPSDTVFIFARAVDGPAMPVAVLQRPAAELPIDFLLNDSQAMSSETKLSGFEQVIVTARISRSGLVTEALKGLEARSEPVVVAENRHVNLTIK